MNRSLAAKQAVDILCLYIILDRPCVLHRIFLRTLDHLYTQFYQYHAIFRFSIDRNNTHIYYDFRNRNGPAHCTCYRTFLTHLRKK